METKFVKNCTYTKFRKIQWKQNLEKRSKSIQKFVLIKLKKYLNFIKNPSKKDIIKKMSKKLYHGSNFNLLTSGNGKLTVKRKCKWLVKIKHIFVTDIVMSCNRSFPVIKADNLSICHSHDTGYTYQASPRIVILGG